MRSRRPAVLLVLLCLLMPGRAARAAGLTEGARLSAVYDEILSARFDRAGARLAAACPPAPAEACLALDVALAWWRIALDTPNRTLDADLARVTARAVAAAEAWTQREPRRAEAWFYAAAAAAPLVQLRVLRGERVAAAREGNRIRILLERARSLDPALQDAQFGIGLYHYYADVAPTAAKVLRWLLLLPGGDRRLGLREMLAARDRGELLRGEADYQLHWLYLWYEGQTSRALALLEGLDRRHPSNPVFLQRIAEITGEYLHDRPAAAAAWQTLLTRAARGESAAPELATTRARLGLAVQWDAMDDTDLAVEQLRLLVAARPTAPVGALRRAYVLLGEAHDRLGARADAEDAYRRAIALAATKDEDGDVRQRAAARLRQRTDPARAEAYRLSLEGWRAVERGDAARGAALLARAHAMAPLERTIHARHARALLARGDDRAARAAFDEVLARPDGVPASILSWVYADFGALLARSGERSRAIAQYERARAVVGGDPRAREVAGDGLKDLTR